MRGRSISRYEREIFIDRPPADVFAFCCQGENLQRISPERITPTKETTDTVVRPNGAYVFRHWMNNIVPVRWKVEIVDYEDGHHYVDLQRRGPFRFFQHTHTCEAEGTGTRYRDTIEFASHLGRTVDSRLVRRRVDQIFTHRQREMKRLLEAA